MTRRFFITGTGTGVGKTLLTAALTYQLTEVGYKVCALKPVASGFSYDDELSDPAVILKSAGKAVTREAIDAIAPWKYTPAISPHLAAKGAGPSITDIIAFCRAHEAGADMLLVEGAGGLMTPLTDDHTGLDLAAALGYHVILVAGSYLGAISHTLTAALALAHRGLTPHAIVVSHWDEETGVEESIRRFAGGQVPVYSMAGITTEEKWRDVPPLTELCLR